MSLESSTGTPKLKQRSPYVEKKKVDKKKNVKSSEFSDSDDSDEDFELYNGGQSGQSPGKPAKTRKSKHWQVIEGLKSGQRFEEKPIRFGGYLLKRRKWPMKGWHKRYVDLEGGILKYAKTPGDIQKGKFHGTVDLALSYLVYKEASRRIDLDAEDSVYHLKAKGNKWFEEWITNLRRHRLFRQHELEYGSKDAPRLTDIQSVSQGAEPEVVGFIEGVKGCGTTRKERAGSLKSRLVVGGLSAWSMDTMGIELCNKDLLNVQNKISVLSHTLDQLNSIPMVNFVDTNVEAVDIEAAAPQKVKKKFSLMKSRHKKTDSGSSSASAGSASSSGFNSSSVSSGSTNLLVPPHLLALTTAVAFTGKERISGSASNPNLVEMDPDQMRPRPQSCPESTTDQLSQRIEELKLREQFITCAKDVYETLKSLVHAISTEKDRLKLAQQEGGTMLHTTPGYVHGLRQQVSELLRQNADLTSRLSRIHRESNLDDCLPPSAERLPPLVASLSTESTVSEYFDTIEDSNVSPSSGDIEESDRDSSSSEEGGEDYESGSELTEGSDAELDETLIQTTDTFLMKQTSETTTGRRSMLPAPQPDADVNLFSLLRRNIGKDLSKISMPVTLNEPLSMLQLICEELEYSDLLDRANELQDPHEQMVYIAAFAVSAYACTYYRAGTKPFNPILGETFDMERDDMGWKFIAEQVSHHPPISAAYCEGNHFTYWQDSRVKTKFWGKSMEIHPHGTIHVSLKRSKDLYSWNKVTSCVHNILHGTRWVDHYGDIHIKSSNGCSAKITFLKATMWSSKRHEIQGHVLDRNGQVVHNLFGKWTEGLYCGHGGTARIIWRPGGMPDDYDLYYGFTRFAIELNELTEHHRSTLPRTDSRFRPDQRMLEEGDIGGAEEEKRRVETLQREVRKEREVSSIVYKPLWFRKSDVKGDDQLEYNGQYWAMKKNGFNTVALPRLW